MPQTSGDIRYLKLEADGRASAPVVFLSTPASEQAPKLSPDSRFVVYMSNESGRNEIYVRPFPEGAGKWQASADGGEKPRWSRDGTELFYVQGTSLMAVPVSANAQAVVLGQPQQLFESSDLLQIRSTPSYDISADGKRLVLVAPEQVEESAPPKIRIVQNWYEEFRGRDQ